MSHFFVVVLLPKTTPTGEVEAQLDKMLEPYNERLEVEPYEEECWCVGGVARVAAREHAETTVGTIDGFRKSYQDLPQEDRPEFEDFTKGWRDARNAFEQAHAMYQKPDHECADCKGTGKSMSTYNPKSKWNRWQIGGQYDCAIINDCRESENGFDFDAEHESLRYNTIPVSGMPNGFVSCVAVVTPEGEWIERGQKGWWSCVANDTDDVVWESNLKTIFAKYADCLAIGCDMHI